MVLNRLTENDMDYTSIYDRIFTFLDLRDYDWMNYVATFLFPVKTEVPGKTRYLSVFMGYHGMECCRMTVIASDKGFFSDPEDRERLHEISKEDDVITYSFTCDIFKKHIARYMEAHIKAWNDTYAFYGGKFALDFYNEVLEKGQVDDISGVERVEL